MPYMKKLAMRIRQAVSVCEGLSSSNTYNSLVIILFLVTMLLADIRNCLCGSVAFETFNVLIYTTFGLLIFDVGVRAVGEKGYLGSFYFMIDFLSGLFMILQFPALYIGDYSSSATSLGKAARLGITLATLIRLLRLGVLNSFPSSIVTVPIGKKSLEGRLAYRTSICVVCVVIAAVFAAPLLSSGTYRDKYQDRVYTWLTEIDQAYTLSLQTCTDASRIFYQQQLLLYPKPGEIIWIGTKSTGAACPDGRGPEADLTLPIPPTAPSSLVSSLSSPWTTACSGNSDIPSNYVGTATQDGKCPSDSTPNYRRSVVSTSFLVVIDTSDETQNYALLSIYRSISILVIVAIAVYYAFLSPFDLVLNPVRQILSRIEQVREDPVNGFSNMLLLGNSTASPQLVRYRNASNRISKWYWRNQLNKFNETAMEISLLERRIFQFSNLLALGFGAAGADIVRRNMATLELDAMIPGSRVDAIFVHVRVENFQTITAVLQDKVVKFINIVTEIVHGIADEFNGTANKTDGENILLVWELSHEDNKHVVYDMALCACAKISIAINRSLELREYKTYPPLVQKLGNFSVKLKFGIHQGWAIRGAIGSQLKIDPRYLSADVNTSEQLEKYNDDYGTCILCSAEYASGCSEEIRNMFRLVDKVVRSKRGDVLTLYSLDLDIEKELDPPSENDHDVKDSRSSVPRAIDRAWRKKNKWTCNIYDILNSDNYYLKMREKYSEKFLNYFQKGLLNYFSGEWKTAKECFETIQNETGVYDKASENIYQYMRKHDFIAPPDWNEARPIVVINNQ